MNKYTMKYRVGIVGHRGYSGAELIRILSHHPNFHPVLLEHREDVTPAQYGRTESIPCSPEAAKHAGLAAVFLATPVEVSLSLAPGMLRAGMKVVDLSGAFRLRTPERYERWYKGQHPEPALLASAVYGLPEFYRDQIRSADFVANPGCYPTAANLALRPLMDAGVIDRHCGVVCDAKSGVSGAGRKATLQTSFCEVTENFSAYGILEHRHVPEVLMNSGLCNEEFSFTAQLIPIHRGILETIYFRTSQLKNSEQLADIYQQRYGSEPFVRILGTAPDLHGVAHTNFCDIGFKFDPAGGRAVVISAIDNLGKGAAGQAVQNLNLMMNLPETEGLL
jgi:N-acetyl-gamma-glutamyl-phosphate reductase